MEPVRLFACRRRSDRSVNCPNVEGMLAVNLFSCSSILSTAGKVPIPGGIVPVNLLSPIRRRTSLIKFSSSSGMGPLNLLSPMLNSSRFGREKEGWRATVRIIHNVSQKCKYEIHGLYIPSSNVKRPISEGIGPTSSMLRSKLSSYNTSRQTTIHRERSYQQDTVSRQCVAKYL